MALRSAPTRSPGLAAAATSVVALLAVAAMAAGAPAPRAVPVERGAAMTEAEAVRVMAMAVAAVACDLLGGERTMAAIASPGLSVSSMVPGPDRRPRVRPQAPPGPVPLQETLLDLPPPRD